MEIIDINASHIITLILVIISIMILTRRIRIEMKARYYLAIKQRMRELEGKRGL